MNQEQEERIDAYFDKFKKKHLTKKKVNKKGFNLIDAFQNFNLDVRDGVEQAYAQNRLKRMFDEVQEHLAHKDAIDAIDAMVGGLAEMLSRGGMEARVLKMSGLGLGDLLASMRAHNEKTPQEAVKETEATEDESPVADAVDKGEAGEATPHNPERGE